LQITDYATDGTVAIGACLFLLIAPDRPPKCLCFQQSKFGNESETSETELVSASQDTSAHGGHGGEDDNAKKTKYKPVLAWGAVTSLNWDIIFLLGGGFALSNGFDESGLSEWLARKLKDFGPNDLYSFAAIASLVSCMCTNVMSNVAAANVLLPAIECVGPEYDASPLTVVVPVALSISLAFLFPIGTPPNAIVLSNKKVTVNVLFKVGAICTLVFLFSVISYSQFIMPFIYDTKHVSQAVLDSCN
jgi:hypothetical protein